MSKDKDGRSYLSVGKAERGMLVQVDDGFDCMKSWSKHVLHKDDDGLYIKCSEGEHYLNDQYETNEDGTEEYYIGIYEVE